MAVGLGHRSELGRYGPFTLTTAWPEPDADTRATVRAFWQTHGIIADDHDEMAQRRSKQVMVMAEETTSGQLAGLSTAIQTPVESLGFPCFYYRTFVAPKHRTSWVLSKEIFMRSYHVLNDRFREGHDPEVLGLLLEVQNESLQRHLRYAVWALDGMNVVYIGKDHRGVHRRVWYFDGALIP
ncbi:MAG: hypothetical protein AAGF97_18400 [Planctomycetota bacterium]